MKKLILITIASAILVRLGVRSVSLFGTTQHKPITGTLAIFAVALLGAMVGIGLYHYRSNRTYYRIEAKNA